MVIIDGLQVFTQWVFVNSLKASILVAFIFIIRWLVHDRLPAKWQHAFWLILIVRLLLPSGFDSNVSIYNVLDRSDAVLRSSTRIFTQPIWVEEGATPQNDTSIKETSRQWTMEDVFSAIWIIGAFAFTFIMTLGNLKCWIKIRRRQPVVEANLLDSFAECRKSMQIHRSIQVAQLESIHIPMLYGWLRPVILLPSSQIGKLTPEQIKHILCHELAHYKRHDILIAHITTLLQILHWFNPLMWLAFNKIRLDREIACDAIALNQLGRDQSKSYGSTILSLLENISAENLLPMTVGIVESAKNLKRRLTSISRFKKPGFIWSAVGLSMVILIGYAALAEAKKTASNRAYIADITGPMTLYSDVLKSREIDNRLIYEVTGRLEITNWRLKSDTSKVLKIFGKNVQLKQLDEHRWSLKGEKLDVDTLPAEPKVWPKKRKSFFAEAIGPCTYNADTTVGGKIDGMSYLNISGKFKISNWKLKSDSTNALQISGENAFINEIGNDKWLIMADEMHIDTIGFLTR
jgi:beta-lactamase regulating signal transducer with metallopeptidase domain